MKAYFYQVKFRLELMIFFNSKYIVLFILCTFNFKHLKKDSIPLLKVGVVFFLTIDFYYLGSLVCVFIKLLHIFMVFHKKKHQEILSTVR